MINFFLELIKTIKKKFYKFIEKNFEEDYKKEDTLKKALKNLRNINKKNKK